METIAQRVNSSINLDFGCGSDCETGACSDSDRSLIDHPAAIPSPAASVLAKMEQLNKWNELDGRSVKSKRSGSRDSSDSGKNGCQTAADDSLWTQWAGLVRNWQTEYKKQAPLIQELIKRQGIPCHFRTLAWQLLSGANPAAIHDIYAEYLRTSSPHEKIIQRDIFRTYPELEFFKDGGMGQNSLFNVIKAYSVRDPEVGYCQGSAFIVGQLLLQMPEEETFAVFCQLMEEYRLRDLYKPAMTELGLCMFQLECLVQDQMPDLYTHFVNMGFDTSMYASSWFLTLFTTTLPLDLADRVMDVFLIQRMEAIFRLAMAILQQARIELLQLDMEGMLKYFQRDVRERFENDHDLLFSVANLVKLNSKKMKKLEKDYMTKRTREQEEAVELRRLRTENRLLRQRIEYLEKESEALADRLIKGQVTLAQEAENCINISHQLNKLRDINTDVHRRLEQAYETIRDLSSRKQDGWMEREVQVDDMGMIEHIHALQQELIQTHAREADHENTIRDLKQRLQEVEAANKRLKETPPDHCIASLQEELISVKMREAEASLSLKEMRQRLAELEAQWAKYIHMRCFNNGSSDGGRKGNGSNVDKQQLSMPGPAADLTVTETTSSQQSGGARARLAKLTASLMGTSAESTTESQNDSSSAISARELEDQLMGVRIREADTVAELKEMRQKVMELETQNHVCTNQLKRQDQELKAMKEEGESWEQSEHQLRARLRNEERRADEAISQLKEQSVMNRLKDTEAMQTIAELKQRIADADLRKAEKWTHSQLRGSSVCDLDDDSTEESRCQSLDGVSFGESESGELDTLADMTVVQLTVGEKTECCDEDTATETDTDSPRNLNAPI